MLKVQTWGPNNSNQSRHWWCPVFFGRFWPPSFWQALSIHQFSWWPKSSSYRLSLLLWKQSRHRWTPYWIQNPQERNNYSHKHYPSTPRGFKSSRILFFICDMLMCWVGWSIILYWFTMNFCAAIKPLLIHMSRRIHLLPSQILT